MCKPRPVVHQHQHSQGRKRIGEQRQKFQALGVEPVQVLENDQQRLLETFADQQAFDCLERALLSKLPVHSRDWIVSLEDSEHRAHIRKRIEQTSIELGQPVLNLPTTLRAVIVGLKVEILLQHFDQRQIYPSLCMGNPRSFEHLESAAQSRLELMKQARLPDTRLSHHPDDLAMPGLNALERAPHLDELGLAADELDQSSPCRRFQPGSQRTKLDHFVSGDRLTDTLDVV